MVRKRDGSECSSPISEVSIDGQEAAMKYSDKQGNILRKVLPLLLVVAAPAFVLAQKHSSPAAHSAPAAHASAPKAAPQSHAPASHAAPASHGSTARHAGGARPSPAGGARATHTRQ